MVANEIENAGLNVAISKSKFSKVLYIPYQKI